MKKLFAIFILLLVSFNIVFAVEEIENPNNNIETLTLKGKVVEVGEAYTYYDDFASKNMNAQDVKVKIIDNTKYNGTVFPIQYLLSDIYNEKIEDLEPLKLGDKVYVYANFNNGKLLDATVEYYDKQFIIITMLVIYAVAIILIGGLNGVKALISLILTILSVFFILVPAIFNGINAMLVSILISIGIIIVTFVIVAGFKKKTLAAIIGTSAGIIVAGIFGLIFGNMMRLTGLNEEALMLTTASDLTFSFKNIMFAGIIIGALGACMDVGMSISSSLEEMKKEVPDISVGRIIKAGMNIGKDVMGTMTNTLILAYVGSALVVILLFIGFDFKMFEILNQEMIAEEILKSIAGSMGLICTIPLTAVISGLIMGNKN